jgi:cytochrome oxidase Cu insertion factor (SCO1/SenC/PrrC family)
MKTTTGGDSTSRPGGRANWWLTGMVLWVAVGLGLGWLAWNRRGAAPGDDSPLADRAIAARVNVNTDDDEAAAPIQVVVPTSASTEEGSQVIDLSELMGQPKPAPETALWDPEGVEDFSFTNQDGRTITKADLLGRPWAICFVFTKCLGPCPTVTRQLRELQDRLRDEDIRLVTLTVDPARDTAEVLANYAKLNGADPEKWYFLTGDQAAIYGLIHRSFKMPVQEVTGPDRKEGFEVIHSTNVMLVNADGVVVGKYNAAKDTEMADLRRELAAMAVPVVKSETPVADGRP